MPLYEYRCERGHTFEVMQRMSDDPLSTCTTCAAPVQRVFHPVAVHFKGSGFYTTDYGRRKSSGGADDAGGSKDSGAGEKKSESSSSSDSGSKKSESSSATKSDE